MYIIERRKASDLKLYESIEVVKSAYVENEHFINAIKKEISTFIGMLNDYYLKDKQEPLEFE